VSTHRNEWIVECTEFVAGRESAARTFRNPNISPQEAVKKHPELQGSYLKLQAVKLGAERDFKNPVDRERLIARARVLIAQSIERGELLEPVRLREPVAKRPEKEHPIAR
jgi:cell filamentation protein